MKIRIAISIAASSLIITSCSSDSTTSSSSTNITLKGAGSVSAGSAAILKAVDPSEMNVKVYKFAVSASTDCTNPITIYENDSPEYANLLDNPTIGSGSLDDGSYPCVMMEVSDNLKFVPASNEGTSCVAETEYTLDVCRTDSGASSTLIDGTTTTCTGTTGGESEEAVLGDDRVTIYLSTTGTDEGTAFTPTSPLPLTSAFTVSGATTATFVVDGRGKVEENYSTCDMQPPVFSFN